MTIPEHVRQLAEAAASHHLSDIQAAVEEAVEKVRALPDYGDLVAGLVHNCMQELVYDARHKTNVKLKRDSHYYGQPGIARRRTEELDEVYESIFQYRIAGTVLGQLKGADLLPIAESETQIGNGHLFNASLLTWLANVVKVPAEKAVSQCVTEKKLRAEFDRLRVRYQAAAAQEG